MQLKQSYHLFRNLVPTLPTVQQDHRELTVTIAVRTDDIKCYPTCLHVLLAKWKCDDHVQRGLWERGGSGIHPVLHQLHPEAQRVSHLCG